MKKFLHNLSVGKGALGVLATLTLLGLVITAPSRLGGDTLSGGGPDAPAGVALTDEEEAWLEQHPVLRVGMDPHWPPFSVLKDEGEDHYVGIDPELLDELSAILGVRFEVVETTSWQQTHDLLKAGSIDLAMGTAHTPRRRQWHLFTDSYLETPVAVVMRQEAPFFVRLRSLENQVAASPEEYVTTLYLRETVPNLRIRETETVREALKMVSRGEADFMVGNLVTTSYLIRQRGLSNLKIAGIAEQSFAQRVAVRQGAPELVSALNKALENLPEHRMNKILENWIPVEVEEVMGWQKARDWALRLALVALLVIAAFSTWNFFLAREVNQRKKVEKDLRQTKETLERLNQEKDELMGMVAHDLNSPLTQVRLVTEILEDHVPEEDAEAAMLLDSLGDSARRMESLTRRLLQMHAAEQQAKDQDGTETTDLRLTLLEIEKRHMPAAGLKSISICQEWDQETAFLARVAPDVCDQIFDNLLSNAIKYSGLETMVTMKLEQADEQVMGIVEDEGPGIKPEEMDRVFQKFAKLSAQPTGGESATGLGLSIVKYLCELVGGEVRCESDGEKGARFIVKLPRARE
jgi:polar amino acid transport system substrate-binding protein